MTNPESYRKPEKHAETVADYERIQEGGGNGGVFFFFALVIILAAIITYIFFNVKIEERGLVWTGIFSTEPDNVVVTVEENEPVKVFTKPEPKEIEYIPLRLKDATLIEIFYETYPNSNNLEPVKQAIIRDSIRTYVAEFECADVYKDMIAFKAGVVKAIQDICPFDYVEIKKVNFEQRIMDFLSRMREAHLRIQTAEMEKKYIIERTEIEQMKAEAEIMKAKIYREKRLYEAETSKMEKEILGEKNES